jgi:hypothetical protein
MHFRFGAFLFFLYVRGHSAQKNLSKFTVQPILLATIHPPETPLNADCDSRRSHTTEPPQPIESQPNSEERPHHKDKQPNAKTEINRAPDCLHFVFVPWAMAFKTSSSLWQSHSYVDALTADSTARSNASPREIGRSMSHA